MTEKHAEKDYDIETALANICLIAHKHEVQYWRDAKGTDAEKLARILEIARNALHLMRNR